MEFFKTTIGQYVVQSVFHAVMVVLIVEPLLRMWRYDEPRLKLPFRLLVLILPVFAFPTYQILYPQRDSLMFRESLALIDLNAWLKLPIWQGLYAWHLLTLALAAATLCFLVQEIAPLLRGRFDFRLTSPASASRQSPKLDAALVILRARAGSYLPPAVLAEMEEPLAFSSGFARPRLVVSRWLVDLLEEEELVAVLAHELAHVRKGDGLWGWALLAVRAISFYNPVAVFALRRILYDNEKACDDLAVSVTGKPLSLASALVKVLKVTGTEAANSAPWTTRSWLSAPAVALNRRANKLLVAARVRRLLEPAASQRRVFPWGRFVITIAAIMGLLFFVV